MPIEIMAARGADTMRFGPLRPVGLVDPNTGHRPWANVQLRAENKERTLYNIVGFQTNLKWGEQKRVFSMIPGLENAEFVRYGVMHRNTFLDAPRVLSADLCLKEHPNVFFAGQITGFEGYMESAACGLLAARNLYARLEGRGASAPAGGHHVRRTGAVPDHREQELPADGREHGHPAPHRGDQQHPRQTRALHGAFAGRAGRHAGMGKGVRSMKILVDAMGGDNAPLCVLQGVSQAAAEFGDGMELVLLGEGKSHPRLRKRE